MVLKQVRFGRCKHLSFLNFSMRQLFYTLHFLLMIGVVLSCKKEHLEPKVNPTGSTEPVVFISTKMNGNSVNFAGGINGYEGIPSYLDTNNNRIFNFILQQPTLPQQSMFKISINNYSNTPGDPQADLDSTVYVSSRMYGSGFFIIPLNAGIIWYDSTGNDYKSVAANPNSFNINSVEDIISGSKKYKKTLITFECFLVHNFTDTIHLTDGEATIMFSVD